MSKESDRLKKVTDIWYKKLEREGFKDIEQDEHRLKRWDSFYFISKHTNFESGKSGNKRDKQFSATWFKSQEEYYQLAGAFVYEHQFSDKKEQYIWELHSQGLATSEIIKIVRKRYKKTPRDGVYQTIKDLAKVMVDKCRKT